MSATLEEISLETHILLVQRCVDIAEFVSLRTVYLEKKVTHLSPLAQT